MIVPEFYLGNLKFKKQRMQEQRVEMRNRQKERERKHTNRGKRQVISIKTDCQTRWGLFKKWGRVNGEGL